MTPAKPKSSPDSVSSDEEDLEDEAVQDQTTLKLMGQSVHRKKGSKKRKGGFGEEILDYACNSSLVRLASWLT